LRSRLYDLELKKRQEETRKRDEAKMDISFGSQIRSYVLQPYQMIKDHRTKLSTGDVNRVLNGDLDPFIRAFLLYRKTGKQAAESTGADDEE
jgi:peptide chain release factor 2